MIRKVVLYTRLVLLVSLIALGWAFDFSKAATLGEFESAQGSIGPATFPPECQATVNITSVQNLGNSNGKDRIQVNWTVAGPQSSCSSMSNFRVEVKITRRFGNVDTGSKSTGSGTARSAVVEVARDTLETDPASFDVSVAGSFSGGLPDKVIKTQGSGAPSLSPASKSLPGLITTGCNPSLSFTDINFFPKAAGNKDVIGVFWNAASSSPCIRLNNFDVTVKLTRVDGSVTTSSASVGGGLRSARVEIPSAAFDIVSFEIKLTAKLGSETVSILASANKKGNF
ncbi:MAG: hypothetical protein WBV94_34185 [Blastocatellia bacterium]